MKKILVLTLLVAFTLNLKAQNKSKDAIRKLQIAEFAISRLYVDEINEDKLVEDAIKGMLKELDPHSTYSNADEVKSLNESLKGGFEGIGIQFNIMEDTLLVIQPVNGGPSQKAGILAGDRIIKVNDTIIAGVKMSTNNIMKRLKGKKGSKVKLDILRRGDTELIPFTITRDKIPLLSIDASYMAANHVGYIKINRFALDTHKEFVSALKKLHKEGMRDLILDLKGNGGGYLNTATQIANDFLDDNQLIVYTEGNASPRAELKAKNHGRLRKGKLIVLIDEFSASASEIVSGAIQDWDRGIIIGRRSFGKGLVQRPINMPDGSMIRLTIARYYTPAGRCIQKPYNSKEDYNLDIINRFKKGELIHADSIHFADSLKHKTLKLGRTVYAGGGIMPDIFVPIDTTSILYRKVIEKGIMLKVPNKFIERNRQALKKEYTDFNSFKKDFDNKYKAELNKMLVASCKENNIKLNNNILETEKTVYIQLKAIIARDLWSMNEYYQVINSDNESYQHALKTIKEKEYNNILKK